MVAATMANKKKPQHFEKVMHNTKQFVFEFRYFVIEIKNLKDFIKKLNNFKGCSTTIFIKILINLLINLPLVVVTKIL